MTKKPVRSKEPPKSKVTTIAAVMHGPAGPVFLALFAALILALAVVLLTGCEAVEEGDETGPTLEDPVVTPDADEGLPGEVDEEDDGAGMKGSSADVETVMSGPAAELTIVDAATLREAVDASNGAATVVNFWATWCPPCVREMPEFVKLYEQYAPEEVTLLSVTADHKDTIDDAVKPFLTDNAIPFDVYVIDAQPDEVSDALNIQFTGALPVTVVYDGDGEVVKVWQEELELADLEEVITPLLAS